MNTRSNNIRTNSNKLKETNLHRQKSKEDNKKMERGRQESKNVKLIIKNRKN